MVELFASSGDPDQTPHSGTVCQLPFYGSLDYNGLKLSPQGREETMQRKAIDQIYSKYSGRRISKKELYISADLRQSTRLNLY